MKNALFIFSLLNLCFSLVPIWKLDENAVPFFTTDSPNKREIETYKNDDYRLVNMYTKNGDGTISVEHKLYITKMEKRIQKMFNLEIWKYFIL